MFSPPPLRPSTNEHKHSPLPSPCGSFVRGYIKKVGRKASSSETYMYLCDTQHRLALLPAMNFNIELTLT